jgi:hypothetical protein
MGQISEQQDDSADAESLAERSRRRHHSTWLGTASDVGRHTTGSTEMSTSTPFGTVLIGRTERALAAILDRQLEDTGLNTLEWVTLTVLLAGGGSVHPDQLIGRVAGARKVSETEVQAHISRLAAAQLLDADQTELRITDSGRRLHGEIQSAIGVITERLWGDLPAGDLATAGRVLETVLTRADQEVSSTTQP